MRSSGPASNPFRSPLRMLGISQTRRIDKTALKGTSVKQMRQLYLMLVIGAFAPAAHAQLSPGDAPGAGGPPDFIALGAGFTNDYLGSSDFQPIPFGGAKISAPGADLYWRGLGVRADFLGPATGGRIVGGVDGRSQFGRDDVENAAVDALPEIGETFEVGGFIGYRLFGVLGQRDALTIGVDSLFDVGSVHNGFTITPNISYARPVTDRLQTTLSVSAEYGDEDFLDTYFSVTADGALASGLDEFVADKGFYQIGTTIGLNYTLTEKWGVFGLVSYRRLINDAADSPIVADEGDANQLLGGLSLSYRF